MAITALVLNPYIAVVALSKTLVDRVCRGATMAFTSAITNMRLCLHKLPERLLGPHIGGKSFGHF